ncbi:uncharacterized protein LOC144173762 [Haemaphysalis longicornis]
MEEAREPGWKLTSCFAVFCPGFVELFLVTSELVRDAPDTSETKQTSPGSRGQASANRRSEQDSGAAEAPRMSASQQQEHRLEPERDDAAVPCGRRSSTMLNPFIFFTQISCCLAGPWFHNVTTLETTRSTATASTHLPKLHAHLTDGVLLSYHALPVLDSIVGFGRTSADGLHAHQSKNVTTDHSVTERHWHVTSSTAGIKVLAALCFTSGQGGSSSSTMLNPFVFFTQIACCLAGPWFHNVTTLETTRSTATASTDLPKLRAHLTHGVLLSYHALPVLDSIVGFGSTSADGLHAHQSKNVTTDHPVTERHWHLTSSTAGIKVPAAPCFTSGQGGSSSSTMLKPFVFSTQTV